MSGAGGRELWKPWANDPESFERAVLADLEQSLSGPVTEVLLREPVSREIRGARLDGSYPNTTIVVSYLDLKTGSVEQARFPVWEEVYLVGETMLDPESISQQIWIWLTEPS